MNSITPFEYLQSAYWDKLQQNGVKFIDYKINDLGVEEPVLKEEFSNKSIKEMTEYLSLPEEVSFIVETACKYWKRPSMKPVASTSSSSGEKFNALREKYFDALDENLEDYYFYEDRGDGKEEMVIKDEYRYASAKEMMDYLNMPDWVQDWAIEMIIEEQKEAEVKKGVSTFNSLIRGFNGGNL